MVTAIMRLAAYAITTICCIIFTSNLGIAVELKNTQKQKALIVNAITFIAGLIVGVLIII
ncbi:MAG: hypothetical protein IJD36_01615 [Clostridia bacterium]|nr:hypothetical protein [Clostridia bacterium]